MLGEQYPFSWYPMFSYFFDFSQTYYFLDQDKNVLTDGELSPGAVSHILSAEKRIRDIPERSNESVYSEKMNNIGVSIINKAFDMEYIKSKNIQSISLFELFSYYKEDQVHADTIQFATLEYE